MKMKTTIAILASLMLATAASAGTPVKNCSVPGTEYVGACDAGNRSEAPEGKLDGNKK
jgi:hypothetical protein